MIDIKDAQNGGENLELFFQENSGLIHHILKKYSIPYADYDDYFQIASIGFLKAVRSFKLDKGFKFATYASTCINNEILMGFRKTKRNVQAISMEEFIDDAEGITLSDMLRDPVCVEDEVLGKLDVSGAINRLSLFLSNKDKIILELHTEGKSQNDIAHITGISQSYVSRIINRIKNLYKCLLELDISLYADENDFIDILERRSIDAIKTWVENNDTRRFKMSKVLSEAGLPYKGSLSKTIKRKAIEELDRDMELLSSCC